MKKLLLVYTALIIGVSIFFATSLFKKDNEVKAAGWLINGTVGNCQGSYCLCSLADGCDVYKHVCSGFSNGRCISGNPEYLGVMNNGDRRDFSSFYSGMSCAYIQVDLNIRGSDAGAGNHGAFTAFWDDFTQCGGQPPVTPPPTEPPPPQQDTCGYSNTQARVHASIIQPWQQNLHVNCGTAVIVGSFHNNTGQFANDTQIQVSGPGYNSTLPNEGSFLVSSPGTYTVSVRTKNKTGGFYSEAACNATTTVSCSVTPVDLNPGFSIEKVATNDDGPYDIGDLINFRVTIRNTGETRLNNIAYRDVFDNRFMEFVSVRGTSPAHTSGIDMTNSFTQSVSGNITTFTNPDITIQLGDLEVGQSIVFNYVFRARQANNRACNDVFASANGLPEEQARDCIGVIIRTDL